MARQPIDRGQICFVAEKYPSREVVGQGGEPVYKSRYAPIGKATMWPADNPGGLPQIQLDLDSAPIACGPGPVRLYIFWDSEKQSNNQEPQGWGGQPQQPPQQGWSGQPQPSNQAQPPQQGWGNGGQPQGYPNVRR